uniref:PSI-F n=1 Tax=Chromera velia CCMP2878 TaxID=1169474 RepID=A0A0G4HXK0_9ALVE|eukprot:Cvel_9272.t1-p1 / transcript=Cvel_9272.t1 / gene=Cvel_9272 / organism=Chromera_velia_CCMP2878 / gene_product=hypothetical protein / transcript_product=hypothetical protein / location=Cvel_scaffold530:14518-19145(-) / protein_length=175 / sequence_SO=supercontig / SO=protein_coding / is_pseudo=false
MQPPALLLIALAASVPFVSGFQPGTLNAVSSRSSRLQSRHPRTSLRQRLDDKQLTDEELEDRRILQRYIEEERMKYDDPNSVYDPRTGKKRLFRMGNRPKEALAQAVIFDFFVVLTFLLWYLIGTAQFVTSGNREIIDAFVDIFPTFVLPALGFLVIGTGAVTVLSKIQELQDDL